MLRKSMEGRRMRKKWGFEEESMRKMLLCVISQYFLPDNNLQILFSLCMYVSLSEVRTSVFFHHYCSYFIK